MACSKEGKHPKRKGKSMKSNTINKDTGVSNSKLELEHYLNMAHSGSRDPEDKNPQPDTNFALSTIDNFLHLKIELLYAKVKEELLKLGYSMEAVETTIIHASYIHDLKDLLDNILVNSLAYIEKKLEPKKEAFQDMNEFYTEALKLGASEYEEDLREVLKREKRCIKILVSFEKQSSILHSQTKEEKQRLLQLE